jgi:arylsulfate sulfotransferase
MGRWSDSLVILGMLCGPAGASIQIRSLAPSPQSPQLIGTSITWTAAATDSNAGPLAFQFNVAAPQRSLALAADFNLGKQGPRAWISQPFVWTPTGVEGVYQVQVVAKDFTSGETASKSVRFQVSPLVTAGQPAVVPAANPLVALFSSPSCPAGSTMRVSFQPESKTAPPAFTNWVNCHPPATVTFEIAGMYASTTYNLFSQTRTAGKITNGPALTFTTGPLPGNITFLPFQVLVPPGPQTDTTDATLLLNLVNPSTGTPYLSVATDLSANIMWYYYVTATSTHYAELTRPLAGGRMLTIQDGPAWNPATEERQLLRQIDPAGNVVRETNTGALQQQLLALGASDAAPCDSISSPAPVGAACLGAFHHDAIQSLPKGYTAVLADVEKIFPPGTQGDTSGLPVDIVGDMIIVLNANWQVTWYWDAFQYLDVKRTAILGETCGPNQAGCPPMLLLGPGIAPQAHDWLHANSLYYWPQNGDILWSSRNQDWIYKIDYNNGAGTGNVLWTMGAGGDFTFNNVCGDPYPWFSHQHEAGMENNGAGPMTLFDNGNTRCQSQSPCYSRGMSLTVNEAALQVTPALTSYLNVYSPANGSAQRLSNGSYFFLPALALTGLTEDSYSTEILPATPCSGSQVWVIQGQAAYRAWRMPSLYKPPAT